MCELRFCTAPKPPSSKRASDTPTQTNNMKIRLVMAITGRIYCFTITPVIVELFLDYNKYVIARKNSPKISCDISGEFSYDFFISDMI